MKKNNVFAEEKLPSVLNSTSVEYWDGKEDELVKIVNQVFKKISTEPKYRLNVDTMAHYCLEVHKIMYELNARESRS